MTPGEGAAVEGTAGEPEFVGTVRTVAGEAVSSTHDNAGQWRVELSSRKPLLECVRALRDDHGFDFLVDVTGLDCLGEDPYGDAPRFRAVYVLRSMRLRREVVLKVPVPEDDCVAPSLTGMFRTADWLERECYDMFGIEFDGHPDMRRILMPDVFTDHPLRKDFPMEGKMSDAEWAEWIISRAQREVEA